MPLTINERVTYPGRIANVTITVSLVQRAEVDEIVRNAPPPDGAQIESISETIHKGQTHTTIPIINSDRSILVAYRDIIEANPDIDLNNAFVHFESQLQIDRSQSEPLFASDMVDVIRQWGMSEEEIQRLLDIEEGYRNNL